MKSNALLPLLSGLNLDEVYGFLLRESEGGALPLSTEFKQYCDALVENKKIRRGVNGYEFGGEVVQITKITIPQELRYALKGFEAECVACRSQVYKPIQTLWEKMEKSSSLSVTELFRFIQSALAIKNLNVGMNISLVTPTHIDRAMYSKLLLMSEHAVLVELATAYIMDNGLDPYKLYYDFNKLYAKYIKNKVKYGVS